MSLCLCLSTHQLFAEFITALPGDAEWGLAVVVGQVRGGTRPQEQPHGLRLVLDDAVVDGGVPLFGFSVEAGGVLDEEVHDVEGGPRLLGDRVVQETLRVLLKLINQSITFMVIFHTTTRF